ncbi:hypothetical protein [Nitrosospira multiformis]|uniref:Uncharacterized protein n=1 Tax=Nitrosospira multiformis TaxID=1231 RepID=A0A1I7IW91_9PROT|nr:hypothetical protein [Nitrosospira multiformis]SFU77178.1 hypothetical protein SAMN05216417_1294 [Nitrosospira multiformis]
MSYTIPPGWLKPLSVQQQAQHRRHMIASKLGAAKYAEFLAQEKQERYDDLMLIVNTCYSIILRCPEPAVRWEAAKLLQQIGPLARHLQ